MTKPIPPLDLSWLLLESPAGTTHVGAMLLFKKPAGRDPVTELVQTYREYSPAPPFNYVPELLVRGAPHFREVSAWDPHYHIGHLSLPAGACYDDLLRLVADLHEPQLDRHRPLFRCWVIDGLPHEMFAIYTKTHHSIIDGESGLKRLYAGLSTSDRSPILEPAFALGAPAAQPHSSTGLNHKVAGSIRGAVTELVALNQVAVGALRKVLAGLLGSHLEGNLPFVAQHAPTNAPLEMGRRFATLTLPLAEMRAVGHHFGATLNDVAASVIDGGLHAYLRETDRAFGHPFIAMCPVSLRSEDDTAIGTRVSAMFVRLGEPRASMPERIGEVVDSVATAKKELAAMSKQAAMTYAVGLVALAGFGASTHLDRIGHPACNLVISNVAGVKETRYLNGARLLGIYPVSALAASIGLNVTMASYHDSMDFGFIANAAAIDDPTHLARLTLQAYQELKEAAATRPARPSRTSS
ncbi:diacylglycerol O-acyltransferase [Mycobacterium kansasii]|uniref:Diacylglycerol O-acyltransferase n=1 Tax=Mycobacterium attenuatum TaxID=2341086 RepID=A0A498Q5L1_9MYCO|nr:wax ester/triacylglycerol synthase family O-acyltransferase [Mycobacterium attenuatum]ORB83028.1 diacylglycerol O-acyltransferase [Mycobacterium kansasii]VBA40249.1 putative diacylglycerol O-acyltransferase Tgs4 [Mycobacterium attenuatum]VBA55555.1 putative diacylglycerol O-acyltransferase Tgs4 [Mycobacterium attenuatum]